ncbi:hypothetical protein DSCA_47230 [Desulfosarcina alkanivorans]|uniref:PKD domain-containing protein n=1 Tax=Desulfosarcina alkanivorans TaxID=571177 RepID=A0A5K7YR88_9BACT|nr:hypothetical protein DSCA_47230 [Desulfosarcina alkanivorans]
MTEDSGRRVNSLHGTLVTGIADDVDHHFLQSMPFTAQEALAEMKTRHAQHHLKAGASWQFKNESSEKMIFVDDSGDARICYVISFFADVPEGGSPARPTIIMDAMTGEIVKAFDALAYAAAGGPGGNLKTGRYVYGQDFPHFEVSSSGSQCTMETDDVKTWDMNHGNSAPIVHSFQCYENTYKEINGAFCPLNDAHYFGGLTHDLWVEWFGNPPLPFQMVLGVHYGNDFENAFWGGDAAVFGDGATFFHPLVGLNVVAHEIAHGFTEHHSNLIYDGESGAINEAFSDMAGEAAEYYHQGVNDFWVGHDIWKGPGAFRYMDDPPKDGWSIDSLYDYYDGLAIHYASGLFNKAFYILATMPGWSTRMAFEIFAEANQFYWEPLTDFHQGAQGAVDAAAARGYSVQAVKDAFAAVDLFIDAPARPHADFSYELDELTAAFTDTSTCTGCSILNWQWDFGDGRSASVQHPEHVYASAGTYTVTLTVTDGNGQRDSISRVLSVSDDSADYCPAAGQMYQIQWIANVQVGGFERASQASGYSDFTADVIAVPASASIPVVLSHGPAGSLYFRSWRIWADLNRDGDFDDAGEQLFEGAGTGRITGSITLPAWAADGRTRLRVAMKLGGFPDACGTFNAGEVEDYTLAISSTGPVPTGPTAAFAYTTAGLSAAFTDQSTAVDAGITGWQWDFGDGRSASVQHPEHVYASAGTYTVTLTVTDGNGQQDSISRVLSVSDDSADYCPAAGQMYQIQWIANVQVGGFERASQASGYSDFTADVIAVPASASIPVVLSHGPAGSLYFRSWRIWADLNRDGDFDDAGEQLFEGAGTGRITGAVTLPAWTADGRTRLRVAMKLGGFPDACGTFNAGEVEDYTLAISSTGPVPTGPTAAFAYTTAGLSAAFTDQSTAVDAGITGWQWDFGDGRSASVQHPEHVYAAAGTYTVTLTVTDGNGLRDTISQVLSVSDDITGYCPAAGQMYQIQWIANVQVGGFERASQASGYSDFTADVIDIPASASIPVVLSAGPANFLYFKSWRVWADFNRDGDFDDAGEQLFEGAGTGRITGSITLPAWAADGRTRLRVAMKLGGFPDACGTFNAGEVEDYTLAVSAAGP